jgi:hypothetical protein
MALYQRMLMAFLTCFLLFGLWQKILYYASWSSLSDGTLIVRTRWRQIGDDPEADPTRVELIIAQPKAAEIYYSVCAKIDQHNHDWQYTLILERKLVTNDWSTRLNLSILAVILVNSWHVYNTMTFPDGIRGLKEVQKDFYGHIAVELIDNNYGHIMVEDGNILQDNQMVNCAFLNTWLINTAQPFFPFSF